MMAVYVKEPVTTAVPEGATTKYPSMKDVSRTLPLKSFLHSEGLVYVVAGVVSLILIVLVIVLTVIVRHLGGCGTKTVVLASGPPSPPASLPDLCHPGLQPEPYSRSSISYVSGYDLPEMLEYSLSAGSQMSRGTLPAPALYTRPLEHRHYPPYRARPLAPSVSPANSTYTGGQSTDCSVSVSGSDHEEATGLQVVTVGSPPQAPGPRVRPEPRPRKVPPAVPSKTVHASLV
jgi:hypothetical protein